MQIKSLHLHQMEACERGSGMIVRKEGAILDVDLERTMQYAQEHSICDCDEDRNFYAQARERFPKLARFLSELGILIERPDETGSCAVDRYIDYHFVAYTVVGRILESDRYEIDFPDGGRQLKIVIDHGDIPNEQQTDCYFVVTVYHICLPWVLDEPFPEDTMPVQKTFVFKRFGRWLAAGKRAKRSEK